jgi:hypothetical protein
MGLVEKINTVTKIQRAAQIAAEWLPFGFWLSSLFAAREGTQNRSTVWRIDCTSRQRKASGNKEIKFKVRGQRDHGKCKTG